jgi:hypothetical protein
METHHEYYFAQSLSLSLSFHNFQVKASVTVAECACVGLVHGVCVCVPLPFRLLEHSPSQTLPFLFLPSLHSGLLRPWANALQPLRRNWQR